MNPIRNAFALALILALALGGGALAAARELPTTAPERVGVDSERLERVTALMQRYVDAGLVPGAVAVIVRDGRVIYSRGVGRTGPDGDALTPDAVFRLASMSKPITSVALMTLWEQGRFRLDQPVAEFVPAFADLKVLVDFPASADPAVTEPLARPVTFRHLLTHTAGFGYRTLTPGAEPVYAPFDVVSMPIAGDTLAAAMQRLLAAPLLHQPGERFTYGLSTDMAGYLVEVLSGQDLESYIREHVTGPLDMRDTAFGLAPESLARLVAFTVPGVAFERDDVPLVALTAANMGALKGEGRALAALAGIFSPAAGSVTSFSGGGGMNGSMRDYARFCQMLLNGGELYGSRVLGPKTVQLMTSNHIGALPMWGDNSDGFGLGFRVAGEVGSARAPYSLGSYSWGGAWGLSFWVDPVEQLVAILATNTFPNDHVAIRDDFPQLVYQALTETRGR